MVMRVAAAIVAVAGVWGGSAYMSGRIAARKARGVKRWVILGLILGPLVFPVHACYPPRYKPETIPCPECGKPLSVRAVACHHCHYRFPAVDVMITRAPTDAESRRGLLSEIAREYGIPYSDATQMLERLPVAGYLVGVRGTPRHAVILGLTVTATHTIAVFGQYWEFSIALTSSTMNRCSSSGSL